MSEFKTGLKILETIESLGFEALIVGGFVRDFIMGIESHDIDIATNMPMVELESTFVTHDIGTSKNFGILCVVLDGFTFEVAQFREDDNSSNSRHPDSVTIVNSFKDDVSRRDFTINALGINSSLRVIDHVGGQLHIDFGIIKAVGNPWNRFQEDALRILRMVRFASKFDFDIEDDTWSAAKENADLLANLSVERITQELFKIASTGSMEFVRWLKLMKQLDALKFLHISIDHLSCNHTQNVEHHPEGVGVWDHTLACIEELDTTDPILNIAGLLHDIGKPDTQVATIDDKFEGGYKFSFIGHDKVGAHIVEKIAIKLKFPTETRDALMFCTREHMRFHGVATMKNSKVVKLMNSPHFDRLFALSTADGDCRGTKWARLKTQEIIDRINNIVIDTPNISDNINFIDGKTIIDVLDIKPGKLVGIIKTKANDLIIDVFNGSIDDVDIEALIKHIHDNLK